MNGLMQGPMSRSPSQRVRVGKGGFAQALFPEVEAVIPSEGSLSSGYLPLPQSKLPPSTTTPPRLVPCPPIHLVAECVTTFTPHCIGRQRNPPAPNVFVGHHRDAVFVRQRDDGFEVGYVEFGIADRFQINRFRTVVNERCDAADVVALSEAHFDADAG